MSIAELIGPKWLAPREEKRGREADVFSIESEQLNYDGMSRIFAYSVRCRQKFRESVGVEREAKTNSRASANPNECV